MKIIRFLDVTLASFGLILLLPLFAVIFVVSCVYHSGSPLFRQQRCGLGQKPFTLIKFRSMKLETDSVGTHEVSPNQITGLGSFLRKTKLDELPQLWNVLRGEMSLVGPRPCLPNQIQLIQLRQKLGVFNVRPGVTGFAQILGTDMSKPEALAKIDAEMIGALTISKYFKCILLTIGGRGRGDRIVS